MSTLFHFSANSFNIIYTPSLVDLWNYSIFRILSFSSYPFHIASFIPLSVWFYLYSVALFPLSIICYSSPARFTLVRSSLFHVNPDLIRFAHVHLTTIHEHSVTIISFTINLHYNAFQIKLSLTTIISIPVTIKSRPI